MGAEDDTDKEKELEIFVPDPNMGECRLVNKKV